MSKIFDIEIPNELSIIKITTLEDENIYAVYDNTNTEKYNRRNQ